MLIPVSIELDGQHVPFRDYEMFARSARDMSVPLAEIGDVLLENVAANYDSEGAWSETPWEALTPKYGEWKDERVPGTPMLIGLRPLHKGTRQHPTRPETYAASGRMREDMLDPFAVHVRPTYMLYEPQSPIAGYHQRGTTKMVARPPVVITLGFLRQVDWAFVRWLQGTIAAVSR